jgi:UDP-N-acetylmuramoyl-tripeptide--D-alanyl-D-alanine ligase
MLKVLREARAERRVLVFSDVSDSRANPRKRQRDIGKIAAGLVDVAVFVGEHGHHAVKSAVRAGMDPASCHHVITPERAAELLRRELRAGDLAFVKGRATHHLSRIVFAQLGRIGCWTTSCRIVSLCDLCAKLQPDFALEQKLARPLAARAPQDEGSVARLDQP